MSESFVDVIFRNLAKRPDRSIVVQVEGPTLVHFTGKAMLELIERARTSLRERGIEPGDRVGLLAPNSARWVAADLAALAEGAVVVPLYARQDPEELAVMVRDATPRVVLAAHADLATSFRAACSDYDVVEFDDLFSAEPVEAERYGHEDSDLVTIIYTSGTSGTPKGVMLDRANLDFMVPQTVAALGKTITETREHDRVFHYLPFCFAGSRLMLWTQLYRGNPLRISTDLNNLVQEMSTADPHYYLNVPALLERVRRGVTDKVKKRGGPIASLFAKAWDAYRKSLEGEITWLERGVLIAAQKALFPRIKDQIGKSLEFLVCGSAPLSEETQRWFEMLGIPVLQVYGLTETTGIVTMDTRELVEPGKVGLPIEGVKVKLSEEDELLIKGGNVFRGYYNRPEATQEVLGDDGWFRTGDLATISESGNIQIIGRLKNLVIPESGHNVAPEPIEQELHELCPEIEHAVVLGHARPYLTVLVTGVPHGAADEAVDKLNAELPHYRKLRKVLYSDEPLTIESGMLTANQKLRRRVIEEYFAKQIDALYA